MSDRKRELRQALGCFATGVTVITTVGAGDKLIGLTANSFNSVSLDPPLVLFSLNRTAFSLREFLSADTFAVNVLREDDEELSNRFAKSLEHKFDGVAYETWDTGCPILPTALASFECNIRYTYDGGDHVIFVGEVTRMSADLDGRPLLYYSGKYRAMDRGGPAAATGGG